MNLEKLGSIPRTLRPASCLRFVRDVSSADKPVGNQRIGVVILEIVCTSLTERF